MDSIHGADSLVIKVQIPSNVIAVERPFAAAPACLIQYSLNVLPEAGKVVVGTFCNAIS
jgi:hypothetical protein